MNIIYGQKFLYNCNVDAINCNCAIYTIDLRELQIIFVSTILKMY